MLAAIAGLLKSFFASIAGLVADLVRVALVAFISAFSAELGRVAAEEVLKGKRA